jgi:hypothetical protein
MNATKTKIAIASVALSSYLRLSFTAFLMILIIGCGDYSVSESKDLGDENQDSISKNSDINHKADENAREKQLSDSIDAINRITGIYASEERYTLLGIDPEGTADQEGESRATLSIERNKDKSLFAVFNYRDDIPHGCDGFSVSAVANVLRIRNVEEDVFELQMSKSTCSNYECEDEYHEKKPKSNDEFYMNISFKSKNKILIDANAFPSKCLKAWDFRKLTFRKIN